MNKSIKKIISLALCGVLLLTGCKERTDTDFDAGFNDKKYEPIDTDDSETLIPVITTTTASETTDVTTAPHITTTPVTTMVTTTLSPEDIYGGSVYTDENGEVLLALTDGIDYVDWVGYYHGYFKLTNVSDKTVTDVREKLESFSDFAEVEEMMIEYPFGDNCVDMIDWENGKPDLENMKKYFEVFYQADYTYDNTLDPDEYCIISVTFTNGTEITTGTTTKPETKVPIHKTFTGKWETVIVDDDGNPMLQLTDGMDYVDMIGYYHGYYKLTNIYDKPVTDIREKLEWFEVFYETDWMMIEYPFHDSCVDTIKWTDGKPDLENISQTTYDMKKEGYTFDNTLDPGEYCIIYATFVNGEEITTAATETPETEAPETTVPKTTAPETTVTTTAPKEEQIPYLTTKLPLSDPSFEEYMPDDILLDTATELLIKDGEAIIAVYGNGQYRAMTADEEGELFMVKFLYDFMSEESYKSQAELFKARPEEYEDNEMYQMFPDAYTSHEAFIKAVLGTMNEESRQYFDDKGKPLINIDPYFSIELYFEGSDGKVTASEVAETAIRWVCSLRAQENGLEDIINSTIEADYLYSQTLTVRCTYKGGSVANVEAHYLTIDTDYNRYVSFVY